MPHDDLLIVYNRNNLTVFKETDLAAVVLSDRVDEVSQEVKLAKFEVQVGDYIIMVGHGPGTDDADTGQYGDRFFGEGQVVRVARSESGDVQFFTGKQSSGKGVAANVDHGDSGGPCFSKADPRILVGIVNAQSDDEDGNRLSVFTSVYPHVAWLKKLARTSGP